MRKTESGRANLLTQRLALIVVCVLSFVLFAVCAIGFSGADFASANSNGTNGVESESGSLDVEEGSKLSTITNFAYTGAQQSVTLAAGKYQLEAWGGSDSSYGNNKGGYTSGIIELYSTTTLYVYVGGPGVSGYNTAGGWNGGGGSLTTSGIRDNATGGGATDFALVSSTMSSSRNRTIRTSTSYNSRILVAGGAGGGRTTNVLAYGNYGNTYTTAGVQATVSGIGSVSGWYSYTAAFGYGSTGIGSSNSTSADDQPGGGGGWYGGGAHQDYYGGGGSGYVLTSTSTKPSGYMSNWSSYVMTDAVIAYYTGSGYVTSPGSNNGYARVTTLNSTPKQSSAATITGITRGSSISYSYVAGVGSVTGLNVTDVDTLTSMNTLTFVTGGVYTTNTASSLYNASTLGWINYTLTSTTLNISMVNAYCSAKSFYVLVQDNFGATCWAEIKITTVNTAWATAGYSSGSPYTSGDKKVGYATRSDEPASGTMPSAWTTFNAKAGSAITYWAQRSVSPDNPLTVYATDFYTDANSQDAVVFGTSMNTYSKSHFTATGNSSSSVSGTNSSITISTPSNQGVVFDDYYYIQLTVYNYEINQTRTSTSGSYTNYLFNSTTVYVVFRLDNTRPSFSEQTIVLDMNAGGTTINLSSFVTDPDGDTNTIIGVKVPTNEYLALDKYGDEINLGAGSNYYGSSDGNTKTADTLTSTATGGMPTGFSTSIMESSLNITNKNQLIYYSVNTAKTQITLYPVKASQYLYNTSGRDGHFYIMVQVQDSGESTDLGIWYPLAIEIKDTTPVEGGNRTYANLSVGESVIYSPFGYGSESSDWANVKDSNYVVGAGKADAYQGLATDTDIVPYILETSDSVVGLDDIIESEGGYYGSYALQDMLFVRKNDRNTNLVNNGIYTATINGANVSSDFSNYFTIEYVDLYLSKNAVALFTETELNWMRNNYYITYTATGTGEALIKFTGIKVTALRATNDINLEFGVDLISPKYAMADPATSTTYGEKACVTARSLVKVNNYAPELLDVNEFDENNTYAPASEGGAKDSNPIRNRQPVGDTVYFDYTIVKDDVVYITPYDFVKDNDMVENGVDKTNSNPRKGDVYASAVSTVNATSTVIYATGTSTSSAASTVMDNMALGTLSFDTISVASSNTISVSNVSKGTSTSFDEIAITGLEKSYDAYTTITLVINDNNSVNYVNGSITVYVRFKVANATPFLKSSVINNEYFNFIVDSTETLTQYTPNINTSDSNSVDGSAETPTLEASGDYTTNFSKTAYTTREYSVKELAYDIDTADMRTLQFITSSGSYDIGTYHMFDGNLTYRAMSASENVYMNVVFAPGTGIRSSESVVLRLTALSSTQGLPYGLFLRFQVTDGSGDDPSEFYVQLEVFNSSPSVNVETFDYIEDSSSDTRPIGYYWHMGSSDDNDSAVRYLVSSSSLLNNIGFDSVNSKVISDELGTDANQRLMPFANNSVYGDQMPTVPSTYTQITKGGTIAYNYNTPTDFMKVAIESSSTAFLNNTQSLNDLFTITYYNPNNGYSLVNTDSFTTYEEMRNLEWAIAINFGANMLTSYPMQVEFTFVDSNQDVYISDFAQSYASATAGGYGATYYGVRPSSSIINASKSVTFTLNLTKTGKMLINNFDEYRIYENVHTLTDGEGGVYQTERGVDKLTFGEISVGAGGTTTTYVPFSYFATTTISNTNPNIVNHAVGLDMTTGSGYAYNVASLNTSKEALTKLSIRDDSGNIWTGDNFNDNPYINISFAENITQNEGFNNPSSSYYMGNRYIKVGDGESISVVKMNGTNYFDDTTGLVFTKKAMRTSSSLTFSISLNVYANNNSNSSSPASFTDVVTDSDPIVVSVPLSVANDQVLVGSNEYVVSTDMGSSSNKLVSLVSRGGDAIYDNITADLEVKYTNNGLDMTTGAVAGMTSFTMAGTGLNKTAAEVQAFYREKAYFSLKSVDYSFTEDEVGYFYDSDSNQGVNVETTNIETFFDGNMSNAGYGSGYNPNPGYTDFFNISMSSDATFFTIVPQAKTALNFDEVGGSRADILAEYNLIEDANGIYYPFNIMVYDNFNNTGFSKASYSAVLIKVYINNQTPVVNSGYKADTVSGASGFNLRLDSESTYQIKLSSIISDGDFVIDSSGNYETQDDLTNAKYTDFDRLTSDYVGNVTITNISGLTLSNIVLTDPDTLTITMGKRVDGYSTSVLASAWTLTFSDNVGASVSTNVGLYFNNTTPVLTTNASTVLSQGITMATGQSFTLAVATYDEYTSYSTGVSNFTNRTDTTTYMSNYYSQKYQGTDYTYFDNNSTDNGGTYSNPNDGSKSLGVLGLATDDTPWNLRFSATAYTIGGKTVGTSGKCLTLNASDYVAGQPLALTFTAVAADSNIPISLTLYDEDTDSKLIVRFYVTVVSTKPIPKGNPNDVYPITVEGLSMKDYSIDSPIYEMTMYAGQTYEYNLSDFVYDIDSGDEAGMYIDDSSSLFYLNGAPISNDGYISVSRLTTSKISISCIDFHRDSSLDPVNYSTLTFGIVDASGAGTVAITVVINTELTSMPTTAATMTLDIKSVAQYNLGDDYLTTGVAPTGVQSSVSIVKQSADSEGGATLIDGDYTGNSSARYTTKIYSLLKDNGDGTWGTYTFDQLGGNADDYIVASLLQTSGGYIMTKHTPVSADATASVEQFWTYINYNNFNISADGVTLYFTPLQVTPVAGTGSNAILSSVPVYFSVEKYFERAEKPVGFNSVTTFNGNLQIKNSIITAQENTNGNYNYYGDGGMYLDFTAEKGDSREYQLYDSNYSNDAVLFKDLDANDSISIKSVTGLSTLIAEPVNAYKIKDDGTAIPGASITDWSASTISNYINVTQVTKNVDGVSIPFVKFDVNYKPNLPGDKYPQYPTVIEFRVYAQDRMGNRTDNNDGVDRTIYNTITLIVKNSAPTFEVQEGVTLANNVTYVANAITGDMELTIVLNYGTSYTLNIQDIMTDKDFDPTDPKSEWIAFVDGTQSNKTKTYSSVTNSAAHRFVDDTDSNVELFSARAGSVNNSTIVFNALTYNRGAIATTYLTIEDRKDQNATSGESTHTMKVTLITGNVAPTLLEGQESLYVMGGEGTALEEGGEELYVDAKTFDVRELFTDLNPDDNISPLFATEDTYLRFSPTSSSSSTAFVSAAGTNLTIFPNPGVYGVITFWLTVVDGDTYSYNDNYVATSDADTEKKNAQTVHNASVTSDIKGLSVKFTITITANPDDLDVNNLDIPYMTTKVVDGNALFATEDDATKGDGFYVKNLSIADDEYITIYKNGTEYNANSRSDSSFTDVWTIKATRNPQGSDITTTVTAEVGVVGDSENTRMKTFVVTNTVNNAPTLTSAYENDKVFMKADMSDNTVVLSVREVFYDAEGDAMTYVTASSKKSVVVSATINHEDNTLILVFAGAGSSEITVEVSDAVGSRPAKTFTVSNPDLPTLNIFLTIASYIQADTTLFLIILGIFLLLLLIIILIIAAAKKRKRMREEIEALLVAEMELEEQMLKLAATPDKTYYQSYGYLPPAQNTQFNPYGGNALGAPSNVNSNNVIGLNAGMGSDMNNYSFPEIDDDDML